VLHDAAEQGEAMQLRRFLDFGCGIHARDYDGSHAIHAAAQGGHKRCVELLVERKADVNATNNYEDTPLHVAATVGHLAVARYLVAKGADVCALNKFGRTPADCTRRDQNGEWVRRHDDMFVCASASPHANIHMRGKCKPGHM